MVWLIHIYICISQQTKVGVPTLYSRNTTLQPRFLTALRFNCFWWCSSHGPWIAWWFRCEKTLWFSTFNYVELPECRTHISGTVYLYVHLLLLLPDMFFSPQVRTNVQANNPGALCSLPVLWLPLHVKRTRTEKEKPEASLSPNRPYINPGPTLTNRWSKTKNPYHGLKEAPRQPRIRIKQHLETHIETNFKTRQQPTRTQH